MIFIPLTLIIFIVSCTDTSIDPNKRYFVERELFFHIDYDSIYGPPTYIIGFKKFKIKKLEVSFDLYTNDITDSLAYMQFIITDGHQIFNKVFQGYNCNGHFEYNYDFDKTLDSIQDDIYTAGIKLYSPHNLYLLVKNLKAYRWY